MATIRLTQAQVTRIQAGRLPGPSEHDTQAAFFARVNWCYRVWPDLYPDMAAVYAVPNGAAVAHQVNARGTRYSLEGQKLREEGLQPGVFDIAVDVRRPPYSGLRLEAKRGDGTWSDVTADQRAWATLYWDQGFLPVVCFGEEALWKELTTYLQYWDLVNRFTTGSEAPEGA